jgi:spermidine synthase
LSKPELPAATIAEHEGVRTLHLGDTEWVQGAMDMNKPRQLVLEYVQRMMAWMLWRDSAEVARGHAVQLGLGAAAITRFCHQVLRMERVTAVELNPAVIAACHHGFRLPANDARLTVVECDAGDWVADDANLQTAQVLNVDLYDHEAAAPVLDSPAFYAACRGVLAHGGLMTVNLFGRAASFAASAERIAAAFGRDQVWSLRPTREGNTVVVAARGVPVPGRDEVVARAATIERRYGLPARKWLRMVRPMTETQ